MTIILVTYKCVRLPLKVNIRILILLISAPVKFNEISDLRGQNNGTGSSLMQFWSSDLQKKKKQYSSGRQVNGWNWKNLNAYPWSGIELRLQVCEQQQAGATYNIDKWVNPLKASASIDSIKLCPKSNSTSWELKLKQPEGIFLNRLYLSESILMDGKYSKGEPCSQLSSVITLRSKSLKENRWNRKINHRPLHSHIDWTRPVILVLEFTWTSRVGTSIWCTHSHSSWFNGGNWFSVDNWLSERSL